MATAPPSGSDWSGADETARRNVRMASCGEWQCERRLRLAHGPMGRAHVAQCHQERQRRLRALVAIGAISMEPVATAARGGVVQPLADGVLTEEPVEGAGAVIQPAGIPADVERGETGRGDGAGLNRLLVECCRRTAPRQEAVA